MKAGFLYILLTECLQLVEQHMADGKPLACPQGQENAPVTHLSLRPLSLSIFQLY